MNKLYGAILGDLAGQPYEFKYKGDYSEFNIHDKRSHITDDSLMTLASASYLLGMFDIIEAAYKDMGKRYDGDYYGKNFKEWLKSPMGTIGNSWGNGCLMRVSPFVYTPGFSPAQELCVESCITSHLHPQSIVGVLDLFWLYVHSGTRPLSIVDPEHYLKPFKKFEVATRKTMDFIQEAYYISNSTHQTIEAVVKCGGDTDTNASIIGELMNYTFNDITDSDVAYVESKLDAYQLNILKQFNEKF